MCFATTKLNCVKLLFFVDSLMVVQVQLLICTVVKFASFEKVFTNLNSIVSFAMVISAVL